jgi:hypothetical protein
MMLAPGADPLGIEAAAAAMADLRLRAPHTAAAILSRAASPTHGQEAGQTTAQQPRQPASIAMRAQDSGQVIEVRVIHRWGLFSWPSLARI